MPRDLELVGDGLQLRGRLGLSGEFFHLVKVAAGRAVPQMVAEILPTLEHRIRIVVGGVSDEFPDHAGCVLQPSRLGEKGGLERGFPGTGGLQLFHRAPHDHISLFVAHTHQDTNGGRP
jgi:hypothetical protein